MNSRFLTRLFLIVALMFTHSQLAFSELPATRFPLSPFFLKTPKVEKLPDRYQIRVPLIDNLDHALLEKSDKRVWLRFLNTTSNGSQILEGDRVIKEIRIRQKKHSIDMDIYTGERALSTDVFYENGRRVLVIDVPYRIVPTKNVETKPIPVMKREVPPVNKKNEYVKKEGVVKKEVKVINKIPTSPVMPPVITPKPVPPIENVKTKPKEEMPRKVVPLKSAQERIRNQPSKRERIIVIDAGHGGLDSGAIGTRGTLEKDINLEMAKLLEKLFKKEDGIKVMMTRRNDKFIPLGERTRAANQAHADLFISIHCNSSLSPKNSGFEVYFLSTDATDKAAQSVARLENSVVDLETHGQAKGSNKLDWLLSSMAINNFLNESSEIASIIVRNIKNVSKVEMADVKEADFFVLRGAQMPSVLIELEYLSHPLSELKLRSSRYRNQLANGIRAGIMAYLKRVEKK